MTQTTIFSQLRYFSVEPVGTGIGQRDRTLWFTVLADRLRSTLARKQRARLRQNLLLVQTNLNRMNPILLGFGSFYETIGRIIVAILAIMSDVMCGCSGICLLFDRYSL